MHMINRIGRVLLTVTDAHVVTYQNAPTIFYSWKGDGFGGYGPIDALQRAITTVKIDNASARVIGDLPVVPA